MKKISKIFLVCILGIIVTNSIYAYDFPFPDLDMMFDNTFTKDEEIRQKIYFGIWAEYRKMWEDFNSLIKEEGTLPYCIYDALADLRDKYKNSNKRIPITFTLGGQTTIPCGDFWDGQRLGLYWGLPDDNYSGLGIFIYGIWDKLFRTSKDGTKNHCLKAVIFHEMLHFAIDYAVKNETTVKNEFSINFAQNTIFMIPVLVNGTWIIIKPRTTVMNLFSDEGVVEDCELKLYPFPCGLNSYKSAEYKNEFYSNGARRFNPKQEDCILCAICKKK